MRPAGPRGRGRERAEARGGAAAPNAGRRGGPSRALAAFMVRLVVGFVACLWIHARTPQLDRWAVDATVASITAVFGIFRAPLVLMGNTISIGTTSLTIVPDCTPLMPALLATIAILAFPAPWPARLGGVVGAAIALWGYNLIRIAVLFGVMIRWPGAFGFVHVYLWQTVTVVVVVVLFMAWLRLCERILPAAGRLPRVA